MSDVDLSFLDLVLIFFIALFAIGLIWMISTTIGPFLAPQYWLLILGITGIFAIYIFVRARQGR